ncbi:MAG TPA: FAD-binding oxidoreductase [Chthoniobacterales bacterium]|nr:FAD-binding oxidoreductase [Chthoniobacterales bacterium]
MDSAQLQNRIAGKVIVRDHPDYRGAWEHNWNQLRPERYPDIIVQVSSELDVVEAVKFAYEAGLKVAVRGGGHAWCGTPFRKGGMLIDLSELANVKIDPVARTAAIEPIISNRDMMRKLEPYELAFPVGHCPQVKASGYLLSGGIGWNASQWGHATLSVTGMEMVTAEGQLITANAEQNAELFWAARGAGAGMFAVVTRFHLKLYSRPKAIHTSTYYYPLSKVREAAEWFSDTAETMPRNVEMTLFFVSAPPNLVDRCKSDGGRICMITATVFANTKDESTQVLDVFEKCPHDVNCLEKIVATPATFEDLFSLSGSMWPELVRAKVESLWSNSRPSDILVALRDHFKEAPSTKTLILFALYPGWANGVAAHADLAYSQAARVYGGPWTMWDDASDDVSNIEWHRRCCEILKPFATGRYLGESDIVDDRSRAEEAFSASNWQRLKQLKAKYDPEDLFHGFFGGL